MGNTGLSIGDRHAALYGNCQPWLLCPEASLGFRCYVYCHPGLGANGFGNCPLMNAQDSKSVHLDR